MTPTQPFRAIDYIKTQGMLDAYVAEHVAEHTAELRARIAELEAEVEEWRRCARYDPMMGGQLRFTGFDRSQFDRCRKRFIEGLGP